MRRKSFDSVPYMFYIGVQNNFNIYSDKESGNICITIELVRLICIIFKCKNGKLLS